MTETVLEPSKRFWYRVKGRVQGVGYRLFTQETALGLGLTGWVRNERDGSVELEAQGDEDELEQLLDNLQQGPCFSAVEAVECQTRAVLRGERGFLVRR